MSIDVNNIADGYDIGEQLLEAYQAADDKEKFLDELDSLKGSGAISNYNRDTFRAYANKSIIPNGNISVVSNVGSTKDLTELYAKPVTDRQDELNDLVQKEFDDTQTLVENEFNETQELVQREFDETQENLNTNTNKIINNDNANHASLISNLDTNINNIINNNNADNASLISDLDSNTDKIIANDNANFAVATAKWDKMINILTALGTSPLTDEDMDEVLAAN